MAGGELEVTVNHHTAGIQSISVNDGDSSSPALTFDPAYASTYTVVAGPASKLQVLVPGETAVPGSATGGRTDTPDDQYAGQTFDITVNVVDTYYNVTGTSTSVQIDLSDPNAPDIGPVVINGSATVSGIEFYTERTSSITVTDLDGPPYFQSHTSQNITVNPGTANKLLVVLLGLGEQYDGGTSDGRKGTITNPAAGQNFSVEIAVCDKHFNPTQTPNILIHSSSPLCGFDSEPSDDYTNAQGRLQRSFTLFTKTDGHYIGAVDISPGTYTKNRSSTFTVTAAGIGGLQLLLPGETAVAGSGTYPNGGKMGSPTIRTAGEEFVVTAQLVDQYFNIVGMDDGYTMPSVHIDSSDKYDVEPDSQPLTNAGQNTFTMNLKTAATYHVLIATDTGLTGTNYEWYDTPQFTVQYSTPTQLQVMMPGQVSQPGNVATNGRSGTPDSIVAGTNSKIVTVYLTDDYFNVANNNTRNQANGWVMPAVQVSSWDPLFSTISVTMSNGAGISQFAPKTASSSWTLTATDINPGTYNPNTGDDTVIYPAEPHYLKITNTPANAVAGSGFDLTVEAYDVYSNLLSTGPNVYVNTIRFQAEGTGDGLKDIQLPSLPNDYEFEDTDNGTADFNGVILRKAGVRWINAYQLTPYAPGINANVTSFSTRPTVTVSPGDASSFLVEPQNDTYVRAGNQSDPGNEPLTAQLADNFENPISSAGIVAQITVYDITGDTGTVKDAAEI
ncbi:MAG: hypothetical protein GF384_00405, partial [Elusimicrobia bacterium]|nr:hypothetical protein [Elusimicrobiota bacterium]